MLRMTDDDANEGLPRRGRWSRVRAAIPGLLGVRFLPFPFQQRAQGLLVVLACSGSHRDGVIVKAGMRRGGQVSPYASFI